MPQQRRADLMGLGFIAVAAFAAFVLYAATAGGQVGSGATWIAKFLFGQVAYLLPIVLLVAGIATIFRPMLNLGRPLRIGGLLLGVGLMSAIAGGAFGLGPSTHLEAGSFSPTYVMERGGAMGEGLWWVSFHLLGRAGSIIFSTFLFSAGCLLLTGASVSTVFRVAAGSVAGVGRKAGRAAGDWTDVFRLLVRRGSALVRTPSGGRDVARYADVEASARESSGLDGTADPWAAGPLWTSPEALSAALEEKTEPLDDIDSGTEDPPSAAAHDFAGEEVGGALQGEDRPDLFPTVKLSVSDSRLEDPTAELTPRGERRGVTTGDGRRYTLPATQKILRKSPADTQPEDSGREIVARKLVAALSSFGVETRLVGMVTGPAVTRYELRLSAGTKVAKVTQLKDDLAYALASTEIRILAPIPGKQAVGVEVPNPRRRIVRLGDVVSTIESGASPLAVWLGKDIAGAAVWTDLALMPHLLVAGTTGSGKSGCINAMLCSILQRATPDQVRLALVDPKQVELNHYEHLPHLLTPVVNSPRMAANVLSNLLREMEMRYGVMGEARCRNLPELNQKRAAEGEQPLPYILCVIDELADLMMTSPVEVEEAIIRLAQKSRAIGIHLVLATQRPSTDIITGTIKVNVPARIAFAVSSQIDSRVILDQGGAEALLGRGDMLFRPVGSSKLQRVQGAYISEEEVAAIVDHWRAQGEPELRADLLGPATQPVQETGADELSPDEDPLLEDAIAMVVATESASVSMLQRRLRVGYTRAGRLIDMLERRGVVGPYEGSKPREVLMSLSEVEAPAGRHEPSGPPVGAVEPSVR